MSNVNVDNFKFSGDCLDLSPAEFEALIKERYGTKDGRVDNSMSVKKAKHLYKKLHGLDTSTQEQPSEDQSDLPGEAVI